MWIYLLTCVYSTLLLYYSYLYTHTSLDIYEYTYGDYDIYPEPWLWDRWAAESVWAVGSELRGAIGAFIQVLQHVYVYLYVLYVHCTLYIDIYAGLCNYVGTYAGSVSLGTYLAFTNRSTRVHIRHRRFWKISRERAWNRVGGGGETSFQFFDLPWLRVGTHHSIISICWVM